MGSGAEAAGSATNFRLEFLGSPHRIVLFGSRARGDAHRNSDLDLLIIEDLQHLPKPSALLLCRLLDHRATRYLPTVLTANAGPAGLTFLPRRLTNRLAGGLVVQVESLSPKSRRELVTFLAERRKVYLLPDAIDWIADRSPGGGIRPAIGLLESLKTQVGKSRKRLDRDAVAAILAPDEVNRVPATVARIIGKVAAAFGIKPKELIGKSTRSLKGSVARVGVGVAESCVGRAHS